MVNTENDKASGRIAIPPPNIRKIFIGAISTFFQIIIATLFNSQTTSAPIRNGGINQVQAPVLNPVAAPIVNTGAVGALVGGASPLFYPPVRINVDQSSQLYVPPGSEGRITVLLKNDGVGDFFFISGIIDKNLAIQFDFNQYVIVASRIRGSGYRHWARYFRSSFTSFRPNHFVLHC